MNPAAKSFCTSSPMALRFSSPNVQGVLGDLPQYARHVRGAPRENIDVRVEKVDEHGLLFVVEGGADP